MSVDVVAGGRTPLRVQRLLPDSLWHALLGTIDDFLRRDRGAGDMLTRRWDERAKEHW
jgi:hypothetical protein